MPESGLAKWGTASNPDGDYRFFLSGDMLLVWTGRSSCGSSGEG
jgi:hypothetical protein